MDEAEIAAVVDRVIELLSNLYVQPEAAVAIIEALRAGLAAGSYAGEPSAVAAAVTADLQSVNGDLHLRLV